MWGWRKSGLEAEGLGPPLCTTKLPLPSVKSTESKELAFFFPFCCLLRCKAEACVVPTQGSKPLQWKHGVLPTGPPEKAFFTALPSCLHDGQSTLLFCWGGGRGVHLYSGGAGVHASRNREGRGKVPLPSAHFSFHLSLKWTCQRPCSAAASLSRVLVVACILGPSPGVSVL